MFRINLLPAQQGDAILIEYGQDHHPDRVLIDAGTPPSYLSLKAWLRSIPDGQRHLRLLVVTHIDTDHIGGVLRLLADDGMKVSIEQIWFNGWRHLPDTASDKLGPVDGEILSSIISKIAIPWNAAFDGAAAMVPDKGALPVYQLSGGLTLTLLSPGRAQLALLRRAWRTVVRNAGLDPSHAGDDNARQLARLAQKKGIPLDLLGPTLVDVQRAANSAFDPDRSVANGSSIAVAAEYEGKSVILGADALPEVISASLKRLLKQRRLDRLRLSALKLSHHGSKHNTSKDLLSCLNCKRYLVSTNGSIFGHPDYEAVSRVIMDGGLRPQLFFNYETPITKYWANRTLQRRFCYSATYPIPHSEGLTIDL